MKYNYLVYSLFFSVFVSACHKNKDAVPLVDPDTLMNPLVSSAFIDKKIDSLLSEYQIPGMSIAVVSNTNDAKVWVQNYGMSNFETSTPVDENTSFWLGSISKHVMGVSMMIARDRGLINLDEDIRSTVETNAGFTIANPATAPITFRDLMMHRSGIIDSDAYKCAYFINYEDGTQPFLLNYLEDEEICPVSGPVTLSGYLQAYLDENGDYYSEDENFLTSHPGDEFEYSNIGAALAGYSLELKTGQTLAEFAKTELFTPLSMNNTSWDSTDLNAADIATPYAYDEDLSEAVASPNYELATWPDGGLRASATDMAQLLVTLMNDGKVNATGQQLIAADSLSEMQGLTSDEYGLFTEVVSGFEYSGKEHTLIGHTGSDPGAFSYMWFNEEKNTGIVLLSNGDDEAVDDELLESAVQELIGMLFEAGELMGK